MANYKEDKSRGLLVSDGGRVYKEIGQWLDKNGYPHITWKKKNIPVHRLVAEQFVTGRTDMTHVVMHKDDNPRNNNADNLQWGTYSQNNYDAVSHGLRKKRIHKVMCIETGEVYQSARDAANKVLGDPAKGEMIRRVCREERGKTYGYHWKEVG